MDTVFYYVENTTSHSHSSLKKLEQSTSSTVYSKGVIRNSTNLQSVIITAQKYINNRKKIIEEVRNA